MSTIVVVKKYGIAAIAADTLTKCGQSKDPSHYVVNHRKILSIGDSWVAVAGASSAKLALEKHFKSLKPIPKLNKVESIFETWLDLHVNLKEKYFMQGGEAEDESFESSHIDVLIANSYGIFGVSAHRAVQEFTRFYSYGAGSVFALGAMFAVYDQQAFSALEIAELGIKAAAEFDSGTGLPMISQTVELRDAKAGS